MPTLLLRLGGPLQAWGSSSRFTRRRTGLEPTKSGILGMLAAAQGRRRSDSIEDLLGLKFGVRVDQPGSLLRDFQTELGADGKTMLPLSERYYLQDALFVAGVEGDRALLEGLESAVKRPAFPLYLGRRSCPPALPLSLGIREESLLAALESEPWQAAAWYRRTRKNNAYRGALVVDVNALDRERSPQDVTQSLHDMPRSFSMKNREYSWRETVRLQWTPVSSASVTTMHDPLVMCQ